MLSSLMQTQGRRNWPEPDISCIEETGSGIAKLHTPLPFFYNPLPHCHFTNPRFNQVLV